MGNTTFYQLWNRLIGDTYLDLPVGAAKQYIQEAWEIIRNERPWSFLMTEGVMVAPAVITGDITFTQYSTTATPSPTLKATLDALTSEPLITRRSIRVPNPLVSSPTINRSIFYDIYGYDPVPVSDNITLSRKYQEASGVQTVQIYRRYFLSPYDYNGVETTDFLRYLAVRDLDNNRLLDLNNSNRYIELMDPRREAAGTPLALVPAPSAQPNYPGVSWEPGSALIPGVPLFELWPHYIASQQKVYSVLYQRKGLDFTDDFGAVTSVLPPYISEDLILAAARKKAYRWAETNKGRIPTFKGINWFKLYENAQAEYTERFLEARRIDEEFYYNNFVPSWGNLLGLYPGVDYAQTHDLNAWMVYRGAF